MRCENCGLNYSESPQVAYTCDDCGGYVDEEEGTKMTTKMTRQHFELIARVLADTRPGSIRPQGEHEVANTIAVEMAAELARTNPLFDKDRFLRAAGVEKRNSGVEKGNSL